MIRSFSHIKTLTFVTILIGFALAAVHKHDLTIHTGEVIVEIGDPECTMCDGTVKISSDTITLPSFDLKPSSIVSDGTLSPVILPFEKITKERAPPSRV